MCIIILTHSIIHASRTDITVFQHVSACTAVYVPYNKENNWPLCSGLVPITDEGKNGRG